MSQWSTAILPLLGLGAGGAGTWFLLGANKRKLTAEANKIDADTESTTVGTAKELVAAVRDQLAAQSEVIDRQSSEIAQLRETVAEQTAQIAQLRETVAQQAVQIEAQSTQITTLRTHIDRLEDAMRSNNIDPLTIPKEQL